jgi:hypothetical protein
MSLHEGILRCTLMAVVAVAAGGCGRGAAPAGAPGPDAGLVDLREMLRQRKAAGQAVPASAADLRALDAAYPAAGRFIGSGVIEYVWGAGLADGPDAASRLLAFETAAATAGGQVLTQDGTIRHVTADEFAALRKAKP